jgi:hypothetical protein
MCYCMVRSKFEVSRLFDHVRATKILLRKNSFSRRGILLNYVELSAMTTKNSEGVVSIPDNGTDKHHRFIIDAL